MDKTTNSLIREKTMGKSVDLLRDVSSELLREALPGVQPRFAVRQVTDRAEIQDVRQLATGIFASLGKIDPEEMDESGVLAYDPFIDRSIFFAAYDDSNLVATTRLIWSPEGKVGELRLPVECLREDIQSFLLEQAPGSVAEIGALAKKQGTSNAATLKLLRELFAFADKSSIEYMVCGLEPKLLPLYDKLFGGALLRLSDEEIEFPGIVGPQVPLMIDLYGSYAGQREEMKKRSLGERAIGFSVRHFFRHSVPNL